VHGSFCVLTLPSDEISSLISVGDDDLQRAFVAVLEAERAGANVSGLIVKLDMAGRNLTEAEMFYKSGLLDEALSRATLCSLLANEVAGEASSLKSLASVSAKNAEWQVFMFSGFGTFVFLIALVLVWNLFKRSYDRKLLKMKPKAGSDVET
jgi:hypothetical protein